MHFYINNPSLFVKQNAGLDILPPILNNIIGRTYKFKLKLTSFNTVKKLEGYTVTEMEEVDVVESKTPKYGVDTLKEQLDEPNQHSKSLLENKRKQIELQAADNSSRIDPGVAQNDDTIGHTNNGDKSPQTSSGTRKKVGKQTNKRQK